MSTMSSLRRKLASYEEQKQIRLRNIRRERVEKRRRLAAEAKPAESIEVKPSKKRRATRRNEAAE